MFRVNAISIKIPTQFFKDMARIILKFIWINKKPRVVKTILSNKRTSEGITISDPKLNYREIVIKTVWYWYRYRENDQCNRIEDPEIRTTHLQTLAL